jgi:hypothetical protein
MRETERRSRVLIRIREVPGCNLGLETGYSNVFRGFPQALHSNARIVP